MAKDRKNKETKPGDLLDVPAENTAAEHAGAEYPGTEHPGAENTGPEYSGVHNMYSGVHGTYSGINNGDPTAAPGMRDFLEKDAAPEEKEKGDYTKVTTLSYDETH